MGRSNKYKFYLLSGFALFLVVVSAYAIIFAWTPLPVVDDPLVRMPGTQPGQVSLEAPGRCLNCHAGFDQEVEPGFNWKGSMMAQSARDFLFWACMTVAAQDSISAIERPNATDICERCHFPKGWLEGRSDPTNASAMTAADFDGVQCDFCHTMYDPFFETTYAGTREGNDWLNYWDETNASDTPSQPAADATYAEDSIQAQAITLFNSASFYGTDNLPFSPDYTENAGGQYFVSGGGEKRASFADAAARHQMFYSRYHKSKYFCSTCHDVSNPALANLGADPAQPLPSEANSAYSYYHVERTFSEFRLSDYGQQDGAPGIGPYAPDVFDTSYPNNYIAKCQDCHLRDVVGQGCDKQGVPIRPTESVEHPNSGQPLHDMTGGNAWVSYVLASAIQGSPNYDSVNDSLLNQGPGVLTLDLTQGEGIDPAALLAGVDRAKQQLQLAASIENIAYNAFNGALSFRIQNQTAHKLISGFPEGRRMFVNIKAHSGGNVIYEVNPYDNTAGTLKGLDPDYSPNSPPLGANEVYVDELVYEMHPSSTLTGEDETFHFALATGRYKDNRIPPKGFRVNDAATRLSEPVWHGVPATDYFTTEEYSGGYDAVSLTDYGVSIPGADYLEVNLYYQTTSREYIEFLRDEVNGTADTLPDPDPGTPENEAYIIQTDPFFINLKAWGDTIWQLWEHNMNVPCAAPFLMAQATMSVPSLTNIIVNASGNVEITWSSEAGISYDVEYADGLYDEASLIWTAVTSIPGQVSATTWEDANTPSTSGRYYKVKESGTSTYATDTVGIYNIRLRNSFVSGQNEISTPCVPYSNTLNDVIGKQGLTGSTVPAFADKLWKWDFDTLSYKKAFLWSDGVSWEWRDFDNPTQPATFTFDADGGYMLLLTPITPDYTRLYFVGKLSTVDRSVGPLKSTFISGLNYVGSSYPTSVSLDNSGLLASGFTGSAAYPFSDKLWFWNWTTLSYDKIYYNTTASEWRDYPAETATTKQLTPGEGFRLVLTPVSALKDNYWTYPKPYSQPPN